MMPHPTRFFLKRLPWLGQRGGFGHQQAQNLQPVEISQDFKLPKSVQSVDFFHKLYKKQREFVMA